MNLYEIIITHYAPKDSEKGIYTYLVAKSNEEVYEWLKQENRLNDGRYLFVNYDGNEEENEEFEIYDEDYNVIGTESFKERIIRFQGDENDPDLELEDLYYGATTISWKVVKENVKPDVLQLIKNYGISIYSYK